MQLIPITPALARTDAVAHDEQLRQVCQSVLAMHGGGPPPAPWGGYLAQEGGAFVGTCAFKTPPDADGAVEIAYFTFPGHEGQGVATRMAAGLVEIAQAGGAATLRAQTLPREGASTALLRRLGFVLQGAVEHLEDGTVWEWRRPA